MTYTLRFLPQVEEDVLAAHAWYERKSPGVGEEFLRTFYACAAEIPRHPLLYRRIHRDFRRLLLRRFPYAIYFRIKNSEVIVFGVFHCARDPHRVKKRLREREMRGGHAS